MLGINIPKINKNSYNYVIIGRRIFMDLYKKHILIIIYIQTM